MSDISRAMINALLPEGPLWEYAKDLDFDRFLDGISASIEEILLYLSRLNTIKNPYTIPVELLPDLEKEYGIITKNTISEETRRMQLAVKIFEKAGTGSRDNLENALRNSGFDVYVHSNDPAIDPAILLDQQFQMVAGDPLNAFAGDPGAYCGRFGGYLLVNGSIYISTVPAYIGAGDPLNAFAGDPDMVAGGFLNLIVKEKEYSIPVDPDTWPFIFFVGGPAVRDGSGYLLSIKSAEVPTERQQEFENIILSYKPVFTWAGIIVTYI